LFPAATQCSLYAAEKMAGKIIIDSERCKGCGLCVAVCPKGSIVIAKKSNARGYFPACPAGTDCTGCAICALVCPDAAIQVQRDDNDRIRSTGKPTGKSRPTLVEEKT